MLQQKDNRQQKKKQTNKKQSSPYRQNRIDLHVIEKSTQSSLKELFRVGLFCLSVTFFLFVCVLICACE